MGFPILDEKFEQDTPVISAITEDIQLCLCTLFLGPCQQARIRAGLRGDKDGCTLVELLTSWLLGPCCMWQTRAEFRQKYSKQLDSPFLDQLLSALWCGTCAMQQMARHMDKGLTFKKLTYFLFSKGITTNETSHGINNFFCYKYIKYILFYKNLFFYDLIL